MCCERGEASGLIITPGQGGFAEQVDVGGRVESRGGDRERENILGDLTGLWSGRLALLSPLSPTKWDVLQRPALDLPPGTQFSEHLLTTSWEPQSLLRDTEI